MRELVDATVLTMAPQYPELNDEIGRIRSIAVGEEAAFLQTLRTGTTIFDTAVADLRASGARPDGTRTLASYAVLDLNAAYVVSRAAGSQQTASNCCSRKH